VPSEKTKKSRRIDDLALSPKNFSINVSFIGHSFTIIILLIVDVKLLIPGFYVAESVKEKHFKKTAPFYLKKGVFWVIFQPL
jgi:hypothetical protein